MTYTVKDLFLTIQGEGVNIGRAAVFIRFAGCNLWSGREEDRAHAVCQFCDTDFVGGKRFMSADMLANAANAAWRGTPDMKMAVLTGGEPLLQVDSDLVAALKTQGFYVAVETNGTKSLPATFDWICVSPKARTVLVLQKSDELKLVYPQSDMSPEDLKDFTAQHRWLSPMYGPNIKSNIEAAANYCMARPEWRLAIQAHKTWGLQ